MHLPEKSLVIDALIALLVDHAAPISDEMSRLARCAKNNPDVHCDAVINALLDYGFYPELDTDFARITLQAGYATFPAEHALAQAERLLRDLLRNVDFADYN